MSIPDRTTGPSRSFGAPLWFVLTRRKRYWLTPILAVVALLVALVVATDYAATPPFVYKVF